jgi:hypothetical protein
LKELHYFDRKFPIDHGNVNSVTSPGRGPLARQIAMRLRRMNVKKLRDRLSIHRWTDFKWDFRYLLGDWNDEWYASLFDEARGRLAGEITPAYSCLSESAISHVYGLMPETKLILLLRDPIDRAWSHARMDLKRTAGRYVDRIDNSEYEAHFNGVSSRLRGDYLGAIRRWRSHFSENQIFVGFYDDILANPEDLLLKIFRFLEVTATESNLPSTVRTRVNAGERAAIPTELHQYLAALYVDDMRELARKYGSHPQRWLEDCESILSRRPSHRP